MILPFGISFTQGPRMEVIQQTADQFMKDNPGVKIKIETSHGAIFIQNGRQG